jgi:hypothetical protein
MRMPRLGFPAGVDQEPSEATRKAPVGRLPIPIVGKLPVVGKAPPGKNPPASAARGNRVDASPP